MQNYNVRDLLTSRREQWDFALHQFIIHISNFNLCSWLIGQLHQACEGAALRGSRVISAEDILFLMRKDKVKTKSGKLNYLVFLTEYFSGCLYQIKVARLLKYLQFRDYKSKLLRSLEDDELLPDTGMHATSDTYFSFIIVLLYCIRLI